MKKKDLLYEFVQSLNKNEVSFFKKYVQLFSKGKTPAYYLIFEHFLKAKKFDEAVIKSKIGSSYAVHKNQLFEKLISALSAYNSQENPITKSLDYLTVASIAARKQLYSTADYLVDKADKNMANQPALTMPLFIQHFKMLLLKSPHQINGDINAAAELLSNIKYSTKAYLIHHELNFLSIQIYNLGRSKRDENWEQQLKEIESNQWVQNYKLIENPIDQLTSIKLNYKLAELQNNQAKAFQLQQEEIEIIEANAALIRLNPMNYLVPLHNISDIAIRMQNFDIARENLDKISSLSERYNLPKNAALDQAIQSYLIPLKSKLLANIEVQELDENSIYLVLNAANLLSESEEKASLAHQTNFYCSIAYLKLQDYNIALGLLAVFEYENHEKKILPEFESSVEILRMICFYELELTDLLEAKIRSVSRKESHEEIAEFLPFFKALLKGNPKKLAIDLLPKHSNQKIETFNKYFNLWKNLNLN